MNHPISSLSADSLGILGQASDRLEAGFSGLPKSALAHTDLKAIAAVLDQVAQRLEDNYPYFHPLYAGQMLKPPHLVARLAYALGMSLNPNNHALDGGRASSAMEKEAVGQIARMIGWEAHLGHLTSGGTMANLEALWIASRLAPGKTILASSQAHFTHQRLTQVLGLPFETVPCDAAGRLEITELKTRLTRGGVGTVVATIGTTATGAVDPLPDLLALREQYGFRVHADAAYGGYFVLTENLRPETKRALQRLGEADSIVIDPHKHGLQPYGCGCVLFNDASVGRFYKHESPYTYFTSSELHLGEISLECSRPGASAIALWATQRLFPLVPQGEFASMLEAGRAAALELFNRLAADPRFLTASPPELDIVVWAVRARSVSCASELARRIFAEAAQRDLHLALVNLPVEFFDLNSAGIERDQPTITCLRSVLMKPEHLEWVHRIWELLEQATHAANASRGSQ